MVRLLDRGGGHDGLLLRRRVRLGLERLAVRDAGGGRWGRSKVGVGAVGVVVVAVAADRSSWSYFLPSASQTSARYMPSGWSVMGRAT